MRHHFTGVLFVFFICQDSENIYSHEKNGDNENNFRIVRVFRVSSEFNEHEFPEFTRILL